MKYEIWQQQKCKPPVRIEAPRTARILGGQWVGLLQNRSIFLIPNKLLLVLEMGLEPISLTACDFESHVYTIPPLQHIVFELLIYVYIKMT